LRENIFALAKIFSRLGENRAKNGPESISKFCLSGIMSLEQNMQKNQTHFST